MRECKSKELKKDIEILSQTFERVVDRKESVIKSLVKDLMEAEEQYSMAMRSHLMNIDNLVGKYFPTSVHVHVLYRYVFRGGTIPEITMRYVLRYLSHDTIHITILH